MKKVENYKKNKKTFENILKNRKNYKIWLYQNPKTTERIFFNKRIKILIKLKYRIRSFLVKKGVLFGKKRFKYFIGYKDGKKINLYVYFSQKEVHIEEILIKLNIYLF